jgi:hypothetical protein
MESNRKCFQILTKPKKLIKLFILILYPAKNLLPFLPITSHFLFSHFLKEEIF